MMTSSITTRITTLLAMLLLQWALISPLMVSATTTTDNNTNCLSTWQSLQDAITAIPTGTTAHTPELLLCPTTLQVQHTLEIHERSVRIGCASATPGACRLQRQGEGPLMNIEGGVNDNGHATNTVQFTNLVFEGGELYSNDKGGAAIQAMGVNLIVQNCQFDNNTATKRGGAMAVDDLNRPILLVITGSATRFANNLSLDDDCHSLYWHQRHAGSVAELISSTTTIGKMTSRQLQQAQTTAWLDQWDDPSKAAQALQAYRPHEGAVLCF